MAKLIKEVAPSEKTYVVELTQGEIDFIVGICHDLSDNRSVAMLYAVDESLVVPTAEAERLADSVKSALASTQGEDYDYFDYWDEKTWGLKLPWGDIKEKIEQK